MKIETRKDWAIHRRAIAVAAVFLLVLQIASIGIVTGVMADDAGMRPFGAICLTVKASPKESNPSAPAPYHVGACCVPHCSSAVEIEGQRAPPELLATTLPPVLPAPALDIDASVCDPELRPQSPRAPPAYTV